jgi:UPF0271 protein
MPPQKYVLDTMVFITGKSPSLENQLFTVPGVIDELKRSKDKNHFEYLENAGLEVRMPSQQSLLKVDEYAGTTGDKERISEVDKALIALASELEAVLVTDDYSLQNLASEMGIGYQNLGESGIKEIFYWELKCKGCARVFNEKHKECPVCGSGLRTVRKR